MKTDFVNGDMPFVSKRSWGMLERWSGTAFLIAGGLFLISPAAKGLVLLTDVSPQVWLVSLLVFAGLSSSLVGLLGLYPQLSRLNPRLSIVCVAATVIAGVWTLVAFAWMMGAHLFPLVSGSNGLPTPPGIVFMSLVLSLASAFLLFGIASSWSAIPSRTVGGLLLSLVVLWGVIIAGSVFSLLPAWLSVATYGLIPVVMLVVGHQLRTRYAQTMSKLQSSEAITG